MWSLSTVYHIVVNKLIAVDLFFENVPGGNLWKGRARVIILWVPLNRRIVSSAFHPDCFSGMSHARRNKAFRTLGSFSGRRSLPVKRFIQKHRNSPLDWGWLPTFWGRAQKTFNHVVSHCSLFCIEKHYIKPCRFTGIRFHIHLVEWIMKLKSPSIQLTRRLILHSVVFESSREGLFLCRSLLLLKIFLCVRSNLHERSSGDELWDLFPRLSIQFETVKEKLMFTLTPSTDVRISGYIIGCDWNWASALLWNQMGSVRDWLGRKPMRFIQNACWSRSGYLLARVENWTVQLVFQLCIEIEIDGNAA